MCINECLNNGVFPNSLKIAKTVPIYKKGDRNNPENYRPIPIIPVIGKVFESLVLTQLREYFDQHNDFFLSVWCLPG